MSYGLGAALTLSYPWLKAGHVIFVIFWVGIPFLSALFGDVFAPFNPWRAVARAVAWVTGRAGAKTPAPLAYPDVHHVTAPLRVAARERGDLEGFHLWAGQAYELAAEVPAGELVRRLAAEAREAIAAVSARLER